VTTQNVLKMAPWVNHTRIKMKYEPYLA